MVLIDRDLEEKKYIHAKLNTIRTRAKEKGLEFDLNLKWFRSELRSHCPILGTKLHYCKGSGLYNDPVHVPSIDRIDPEKGYVQDNCRIISFRANMLLSNACLWEMRKVLEAFEHECSNPNTSLKNSKLCQKPGTTSDQEKSSLEVDIKSLIVKA